MSRLAKGEEVDAPEPPYGVEMDDHEMAAFLQRRGHGVLSFGGEEAYAFPVSFGYDVTEHRCILQLVFTPGSRKREFLDPDAGVRLTAYEREGPDDWRSVMIGGRLSPLSDAPGTAVDAAEVFAPYATTVSLSVFDGPTEDLEPAWYELRIEEMSGRRSPSKSGTTGA